MKKEYIILDRVPKNGFPASHLLINIEKGKLYKIVDEYAKSVAITDDANNKVWISNTVFKRHFRGLVGTIKISLNVAQETQD